MLTLGAYRVLTVCFGAAENLFLSGIMFGWASLVYVLKQEGYFSQLCISTNTSSTLNDSFPPKYQVLEFPTTDLLTQVPLRTGDPMQGDFVPESNGDFPTCPEQDAQLQLVFTIATFCYEILLFPMGMMLDKFGTLLMRLLSSCLIITSLLLVAFSSMDTAYFLFPASAFLAVGGIELLFINMQISNLFGRRKATVMTILSGFLDSSAFVFIVVKLSYENLGTSLQTSFFVLAGACSLLCVNTVLLPKWGHIPYPLPPGYRQKEPAARGVCDNGQASKMELEKMHESLSDEEEPEASAKVRDDPSSNSPIEEATVSSQSHTEAVKSLHYPTLRSCFFSLPALFLLLWFSLLQLNMFFFLGTVNPGLERLAAGDQAVVSQYTTALAIFQACSLFVSPLCGLLLDRNRTKKMMAGAQRGPYDDLRDSRMVFALVTFLYIAFNVTCLINVIEVRYVTFVLHIITRSFMYSLVVTGCALFFPIKFFGSTSGLVESAASLVGLLQRPMFSIQQNHLDNDPFWLYIALIILDIITLILPVFIHIHVKQASKSASKAVDKSKEERTDIGATAR